MSRFPVAGSAVRSRPVIHPAWALVLDAGNAEGAALQGDQVVRIRRHGAPPSPEPPHQRPTMWPPLAVARTAGWCRPRASQTRAHHSICQTRPGSARRWSSSWRWPWRPRGSTLRPCHRRGPPRGRPSGCPRPAAPAAGGVGIFQRAKASWRCVSKVLGLVFGKRGQRGEMVIEFVVMLGSGLGTKCLQGAANADLGAHRVQEGEVSEAAAAGTGRRRAGVPTAEPA